MELGEGETLPDLALPPDIDEYVPLQAEQYGTSPNSRGHFDRHAGDTIDIHNAHALPSHSRVCTGCLYCLSQVDLGLVEPIPTSPY